MTRRRRPIQLGIVLAFQAVFAVGVVFYDDARWVWVLLALLALQGWFTERHLWFATLGTIAPFPCTMALLNLVEHPWTLPPEMFLRGFGIFYYYAGMMLALSTWSYVAVCAIPCYLGWFLRHRRFPAFDAPELISILEPGPRALQPSARVLRLHCRPFDRYVLSVAMVRVRS